MKTNSVRLAAVFAGFLFTANAPAADPYADSWLTTYASKYARIYTNDAAKTAGNAAATWSNGTQTQSSPAYAGVQAVYSSSNWVYLKTSGLGQHIMGPWQNGSFPNLPKNQNVLYRIPRIPVVHTATNLTGLGAIGYFVDGVAMFDSRDGFVWTGSAESGNGTGYWNREAYVNEGATFDPGYAHQEQTGTHHYHANPIALRYLTGDHVDFDATTKTYSESTNAVTKHSPILGWVRDGYPMYGPYSYSSASNSASGLRRMISGFVLRNGSNGTDNLTNTLRASLPAWALRFYGTTQTGPTVIATYPISRYMEDYAYLGDLGKTQGVDFDLDEYNGRWCVTPEFPQGTYAYFVSMSSNGTPVFPNNIGRAFYGNPTGATATIGETVTTNFLGGADLRESMNPPARSGNNIVLTWSAVEGGTYRVEAESNLSGSNWVAFNTNTVSGTVTGTATETNGGTNSMRFYRVARTGIANYDGYTGGGGASFVAPGGSVSRGSGTNITVSITLPTGGSNPPMTPPTTVSVTSVTLGGIVGTSVSYAVQGTVVATFAITAGTSLGAKDMIVTFPPPPPPAPQNNVVFTLTGGFTINP
ncbi:MAG: YHYH protein [Pedosphaera sp.]|nr:YHYH protein [Pedosphaera sp.]